MTMTELWHRQSPSVELRALASASRRRLPPKLSRPSADGILIRERLFARLDDTHGGSCIWISAPAGTGKTALVSSWVEARRHPCTWYQVDGGDSDLEALFHYLGMAGSAAGGRRNVELPHRVPEPLPELQVFVHRFFESYCALFRSGCVLVLDNYQDVSKESLFHNVVVAAAQALPPDARLVCISRQPPPAPLSRCFCGSKARSLEWTDLRFTDDEAIALAGRRNRSATFDIVALNSLVRGWAGGLKLLLQADVGCADGGGCFADRQQTLFDHLAREVFECIPLCERTFLIRTAFMPQISAREAEQLTGSPDAEETLSDLSAKCLFVEPRQQGVRVFYEYHSLFRVFLMGQARVQLPNSEVNSLQRRAAQLLKAKGNLAASAELAAAAEDWTELSNIILNEAPALVAQGRSTTLDRWIAQLPGSYCEQDPWLAFWRCAVQGFRFIGGDKEGLERSFRRYRAAGDHGGAFMAIACIMGNEYAVQNNAAALDLWISEFESLLAASGGVLPTEVEVPVLCFCHGIVYRRPDHVMLPALIERAVELAPTLASPALRYAVGGLCLNYFSWRGDLSRAHAFGVDLVRGPSPQLDHPSGAVFETWRGVIQWQMGELDSAEQLLRTVLESTKTSGVGAMADRVKLLLALMELNRGNLPSARTLLHPTVAKSAPKLAVSVPTGHLLQAVMLSVSGQVTEGAIAAIEAYGDGNEHGSPFFAAATDIALAYVLMLAARHSEAKVKLESALAFAMRMPSHILQFSGLLGLAWSKFESNDDDAALACLREGMAIGRSRSFIDCFPLWVPHVMSGLMARALEHGIEADYARQLIHARELPPPDERLDLSCWSWRVRVYTLGRFAILLDDMPLRLPSRAPKKPLELLKALIAFGNRGVAVATLAASLWPDQEEGAARNALNVALHRLRKLFGDDEMIVLYEGKLVLDHRRVWVDAWAFERLTSRVLELTQCGCAAAPSDLLALSRSVIRGYLGHFLADEDLAWAAGHRERLRSKFVRATTSLAKWLEKDSRYEEAIDLQRRVIELDMLAEEFHRGLMRNLGALGRIAEGIDAYRRCRHLLSVILGIEPSAETNAVYLSLKDGGASSEPGRGSTARAH